MRDFDSIADVDIVVEYLTDIQKLMAFDIEAGDGLLIHYRPRLDGSPTDGPLKTQRVTVESYDWRTDAFRGRAGGQLFEFGQRGTGLARPILVRLEPDREALGWVRGMSDPTDG